MAVWSREEGPEASNSPASGIQLQDPREIDVIRQALALAGGNKSHAARLLGLTQRLPSPQHLFKCLIPTSASASLSLVEGRDTAPPLN